MFWGRVFWIFWIIWFGCELIDAKNISLPRQNMKFGGELAKGTNHKLHILSSRLILRHKYLWTMFWGRVFWIFWIIWFFPRKYKYRCIRIYVWFKDDKHVIWMWIWLVLLNFIYFCHLHRNYRLNIRIVWW
jgi:hypothetical protein